MKEMSNKLLKKDEITKNILKGAKEATERRQQIKDLQKNSAAKKITKAIKSGVNKIKANKPLSESVTNFLESEPEPKAESDEKNEKKQSKLQEARDIATKWPADKDKLKEVISGLESQIEKLDEYEETQKITSEEAQKLNKKFEKYGILKEFRGNTTIKTVKDKLTKFKEKFELQLTEFGIQNLNVEPSQKKEKAHKSEYVGF
jgi:DNA repair ATPase RecN